VLLLIALAAVAISVFPHASGAVRRADPGAPPGAGPTWLPSVDWVMDRWVPFNEDDLARALGFQTPYLAERVMGDHTTLTQIAHRQHRSVKAVEAALMRPWAGRATPAQRRRLRAHIRTMFTQPHLAVHMLRHPQHVDVTRAQWTRVFGIAPAAVNAEIASTGATRLQVALKHRRAGAPVKSDLRRIYAQIAQRGVRAREMLPSEARIVRAGEDRSLLTWWNESAPIPLP
jgi:hypothetical protein